MANSNLRETWEARSRKEQADFMKNISDRLGRPAVKVAPAHPFRGAPDFWKSFDLPVEEKLERFMSNWKLAGGHTVQLANMNEVRDFIVNFCKETEASSIVLQDQELLRELELNGAEGVPACRVWNTEREEPQKLVESAAFADLGIAVVDFAVAYTGSVVVRSDAHKGRSTSLLPKVFMAVIPVEKVTTRLGEVMSQLEEHRPGQDTIPAGIHFISGPSRSADIENDLTIGVHGPGIVYALVVG